MDAKTRNVIALLAIVVLVAASLWLLLPMKKPDTLQYTMQGAQGPETQTLKLGNKPVELGSAGPITSSSESTTTATLSRRPGTSAIGLSEWWLKTPTSSTNGEQLTYGRAFSVGGEEYVLREGRTSITEGLDIRGGLSVIITTKPLSGQSTLTEDVVQRVESILSERVNGFGVSEASVQRQGQNSFLIQLPGIQNADEALKLLGEPGRLEFFELSSVTDPEALALIEKQIEAARSTEPTATLPALKEGTYKVFLTGDVITNAQVTTTQNGAPAVSLTMNDAGAKTWAEVTTRLAGTNEPVVIALDGHVKSAPVVRNAITDGKTIIEGGFASVDEAKALAAVLQSGAMPAQVVIDEARVVGPTLGQDSLNQGLLAGLVGLIFVAIFMAIYYRGLGVLSWISLVLYGVIFLGILAVLSSFNIFSMTLPGIAGVILTIGVAADTSILIFERLKEEIDAGKTHRSAAKSGVRHAIATSIDADVVTAVSALALYFFAIGPVRGFAFTLLLGIVIDLVVAVLFTGPVVRMLAEGPMVKMPALFGVKAGGTRG